MNAPQPPTGSLGTNSPLTKQDEPWGNEALLRYSALNQLPDALLLISDDFGVEFVNQEFCTLYRVGGPPESLIGLSSADIAQLAARCYAEPEAQFQRIMDIVSRREVVREEEVLLKDGRTFQRSYFPIEMPGRRYTRIWHNRDITERKRYELALAASEARFRALFQHHAAIMLIVDPETGAILDANAAAVQFYGWPLSVLRTMRVHDINLLPEDEVQRRLGAAARSQQIRFEFRHRRAEGPPRDVEAYANRIEFNGRTVLYSIIHDITDRKEAEAKLARNEALVSSVCALAKIGGWEYDVRNQAITWTDETFRLHDLPPGPAPQAELAMGIVHADDRPRLEAVIKKALDEGKGYTIEVRLATAQGRIRWVREIAQAQVENGQVVKLTGTVQDITERKETERIRAELESQQWQIQKSDSLHRMSAAVAHIFNNKLQAVILSLDLALGDGRMPSDKTRLLRQAMVAARQAAGVSSTLLTFLGQSDEGTEPIDLSKLCRDSIDFLKASLTPTATFKTSLQDPGPRTEANPHHLRQVLINLVANAQESYLADGGLVCLSTGTVPAENIPVSGRFPVDFKPRVPSYAYLEVNDLGCGIASGDLGKVFDPFFTTKFVGRGLGLPVVLGIARRNQGCVCIASAPTCGTTVRVFLPLAAAAAS